MCASFMFKTVWAKNERIKKNTTKKCTTYTGSCYRIDQSTIQQNNRKQKQKMLNTVRYTMQ